MITQEQQIQASELIKTLAKQAWESSTFKEQLINNPVSTIESVTGQKILPEVKFVVEDQTDESIVYLNIPRKVEISELELSDEQLEVVAGGTSDPVTIGLALGAVFVASLISGYTSK